MRKVAFIGTGGTISSLGTGPLDLQDYGAQERRLEADAIVARTPELAQVADVIPVNYRAIVSPEIGFVDWRALVLTCDRLVAEIDDLAGIVIGHGTASLEETAYMLNLTVKVAIPVVLVGSQRPASGLSTDANLNLLAAVRVAASEAARGMGVLVVLNDEIQAAREVTKTSTLRLQTFRTPDFGVLGHADADKVAFIGRRCARGHQTPSSTSARSTGCRGWTSSMRMPARTGPRCAPSSRRAPAASSRPGLRLGFRRPATATRWRPR